MTKTFEIDGKIFQTDAETLAVLRSIVPSAKAAADSSAVYAVIHWGTKAGRIAEVGA